MSILGAEVPELQLSGVRRVRMSYEDWLAMPYDGRSEWVNGEAFLMPPVAPRHSDANFELMTTLRRDLKGVYLYSDVGLRIPHERVRAPDVVAVTRRIADGFAEEVPVLVAEILSRETRHIDLVVKSTEYLAFGIGQYWILDPRDRVLDALANRGHTWEPIAHLDEDTPTGTVTVGDHGEVALDLDLIVPP